MRPLDPTDGRPLYRQVADEIRAAITSGTLHAGQLLPTEANLAEMCDVSVDVIRQGLAVLRAEGLIDTVRGKGSRVRAAVENVAVEVPPGVRVRCRMPSPQERSAIGAAEGRVLPDGVPVFVIERDGAVELLPGDRVTLVTVGGVTHTLRT